MRRNLRVELDKGTISSPNPLKLLQLEEPPDMTAVIKEGFTFSIMVSIARSQRVDPYRVSLLG